MWAQREIRQLQGLARSSQVKTTGEFNRDVYNGQEHEGPLSIQNELHFHGDINCDGLAILECRLESPFFDGGAGLFIQHLWIKQFGPRSS